MTYTTKERLAVVKMHLGGMSLREIEREFGVDRKEAGEWCRRYLKVGIAGIERQENVRSSYEIRVQAVREHLEKGATYRELCDKYGVSRSRLKDWVAMVREGGYEALVGKKRGRPSKAASKDLVKPVDKPAEKKAARSGNGSTPSYEEIMLENIRLKRKLHKTQRLLSASIVEV